jgi:hypothetical protein
MYIPNERCVLFRVTEEKHEKDSFNRGRLDGEKCQNSKKVFGISKKFAPVIASALKKLVNWEEQDEVVVLVDSVLI